MAINQDKPLHVVAAVVKNSANQVLLARRPEHRDQGGLWEFPGGKVEADETPQTALRRELHEELGIEVQAARPLIRIPYRYPDKAVLLDVWQVTAYAGEPHGREGQPVEWVRCDDLPRRSYPAANRSIVTAARLPPLYLITPEPQHTMDFLSRLEMLLDMGISLVQMRAKTLEFTAYAKLAEKVAAMCNRAGATLLLNAEPSLADDVGAAGVHLSTDRLLALTERPLRADQWVAASCHTAEELLHACRIGVDFVVIAPVQATASHPVARPLGWSGLARLTEQATLPVYALGGMKLSDLATAWNHGAQGIAAISALWDEAGISRSIMAALR